MYDSGGKVAGEELIVYRPSLMVNFKILASSFRAAQLNYIVYIKNVLIIRIISIKKLHFCANFINTINAELPGIY